MTKYPMLLHCCSKRRMGWLTLNILDLQLDKEVKGHKKGDK